MFLSMVWRQIPIYDLMRRLNGPEFDRRTSVQSLIERASFVKSRVPDGDLP